MPADTLRAAGLRRTRARLAVLARIEALERPVTHAELLRERELHDLDAITLYRTLGALVEALLVHRVQGIDGTWRYCAQPKDASGCPGNHTHFLCTSCGGMRCLTAQPMPKVAVPDGAEVHGRHFLVHGRCPACVTLRATPNGGPA